MALTLTEIRQQYPEYADMSDEVLAHRLHQAYYSDMAFNDFANKIGLEVSAPTVRQQPGRAAWLLDNLAGEAEVAATLGSSIAAEPLSGLAGIAASLNPFGDPGDGARAVQWTRDALTYQPRTEVGRGKLESVAGVLEPFGEALASVEEGLGDAAYDATGSPAIAAAATTVPTAALEVLGVGLGKGFIKVKRATPDTVHNELQQLGINTEHLSDADLQRIAEQLNKSGDFSGDSLINAVEQKHATRDWVPRTRAEQQGIETNDFSLWRMQNEGAAGKYGTEAERAVNDFTDMRERQLGKVVQNQMDNLGPTQGGNSLAAMSNQLHEGILSKVQASRQAKTDAYNRVDEIAAERGPMMAEPHVMQEGLNAAYQGFNGKIKLASEVETPKAYGLFQELTKAMRGERTSDLPGALAPVGNRMDSLDNFESLRRRISAAERSADPGSADQALLGQVRRQYDSWLDSAVESGKFFGDAEQLVALKEARKLNREYMQIIKGTHKDGKPTARTRIINDVVNGRSSPEEVVSKILGSSGTKQGAQVVKDFKRLFGVNSPEFGALRQAAFMNIFGKAIKVAEDGSLRLSKGNYINSLSNQLKNNESNLRALFGGDEIHRWNKFAGELKHLQEDVRKKNFSGTAYHLNGVLRDISSKLDLITARLVSKAADGTAEAWNWRKLRKHGLAEGDFTVSNDTAALLGVLLGGGVTTESANPVLLLSEDEETRNQGALAGI
ncbi:hypothetical protein [Microbulbifer discodermiae]|uniref:hypothetical protein n=1 Tax=Microbulbifer sp. 2201CG32-9 TaxID=3232309 RepID=UPI00345B5BB2